MANYHAIKAAVNAYIKRNGRREITGSILNSVLSALIDSLGKYFQFRGVITPDDVPGDPDQNVAYIGGADVYPNFEDLEIPSGYIGVFMWNGEWEIKTIPVGKDYDQDLRDLSSAITNLSNDVLHLDDVNNEDLIIPDGGKLQFANRTYNAQQPNGMGYKILRKDATFASQVTDTNTIYEIRYDFDINGDEVTIPAGCELRFIGGSIKDTAVTPGSITLSGTKLSGDISFDKSVSVVGTFGGEYLMPEYFGAKGDGITDDSTAFQRMSALVQSSGCGVIRLNEKSYVFTTTAIIELNNVSGIEIYGNNATLLDGRLSATQGGISGVFHFQKCKNIYVERMNFKGNTSESVLLSRAILNFRGCSFMTVRDITGYDLVSNLVRLEPESGVGDCTDFLLENIIVDYCLSHGIAFTARDYSLLPGYVKRGVVRNARISNCGRRYGGTFDGWATGLDFGEALTACEDVLFDGCVAENNAETGFYAESSTGCKNVTFIGCTSKNNGQKANPTFGRGFQANYGTNIVKCFTEGNAKEPVLLAGVSTNPSFIDICDKDAGRITFNPDFEIISRAKDECIISPKLNPAFGFKYMLTGQTMDKSMTPVMGAFGRPMLENFGGYASNGIFIGGKAGAVSVEIELSISEATNAGKMLFVFSPVDATGKLLTGNVPESPTTNIFLNTVSTPNISLDILGVHKVRQCVYIKENSYYAMAAKLSQSGPVRFHGMSIKRMRLVAGENLMTDPDLLDGGEWYGLNSGAYLGNPVIFSTDARVEFAGYLGERWLTRAGTNNLSTSTCLLPTDGRDVKITVSHISASDLTGLGITAKFTISNATQNGLQTKNLTVLTTKTTEEVIVPATTINDNVFRIVVSESGTITASTPKVYIRIDKVELVDPTP